jgi:hypothetical protein
MSLLNDGLSMNYMALKPKERTPYFPCGHGLIDAFSLVIRFLSFVLRRIYEVYLGQTLTLQVKLKFFLSLIT